MRIFSFGCKIATYSCKTCQIDFSQELLNASPGSRRPCFTSCRRFHHSLGRLLYGLLERRSSNHNFDPRHLHRRQRCRHRCLLLLRKRRRHRHHLRLRRDSERLPIAPGSLQQSSVQHPWFYGHLHQSLAEKRRCSLLRPHNTSFSGDIFSSNTAVSPDGDNHAYITPFNGTIGSYGTIVGTYVGMEDLPNGQSDWDYNDDTFVFTNVDPAATPEPSTFALLGTGLIGVAGALRRKFVR